MSLHDDSSYIHRLDEHSFLMSIVDGSYSGDIYINGLNLERSAKKVRCLFSRPNSSDTFDVFMHVYLCQKGKYDSGNEAFQNKFYGSRNIRNIKVIFDSPDNINRYADLNSSFRNMPELEQIEIIFTDKIFGFNLSYMTSENVSLKTYILRISDAISSKNIDSNIAGGSNTVLDTIVLDTNSIVSMSGAYLAGKFVSGGAGGTIYIPKLLYDHLGDGSSLDYKAATNWSTYDGYGTITWAQIEGSEYEAS